LVGDLDGALRVAAVAPDAGRWVGGAVDRPLAALAAAVAGDLEAVDGVELARLVRMLLEAFRHQVIEQFLRVLGQRSHVSPPPACYRGRRFQSTLTAENGGPIGPCGRGAQRGRGRSAVANAHA